MVNNLFFENLCYLVGGSILQGFKIPVKIEQFFELGGGVGSFGFEESFGLLSAVEGDGIAVGFIAELLEELEARILGLEREGGF